MYLFDFLFCLLKMQNPVSGAEHRVYNNPKNKNVKNNITIYLQKNSRIIWY